MNYSRRAYIYSFLLHGSLLLLMLNIPVLIEAPEEPAFFELNLGSVSQERVEQILDEAQRREAAERLDQQSMTPGERVEVPERRMLEIEEPTVSVSAEQRLESSSIVSDAEKVPFEVESPSVPVSNFGETSFPMDRKETFEGSQITIGDEPGTGIETGTIGADLVFEIQGEIEGRAIAYNPLPEYPEGLNQNAVIRISFVVLPDGSVSSSGMVPVRKENATLEDITMDALRRWRFSPLPAGDTRTQTGVITFNFKVQ